jgi:hypothetical protein
MAYAGDMQDIITESERMFIEILTQHEVTTSAYDGPLRAVDGRMDWVSGDTRRFVDDLRNRELLQLVPIMYYGSVYDPKSYWRKGRRFSER